MKAQQIIDGIPVNPQLPRHFWNTDNERRPASHDAWWYRPFVLVVPHELWPQGTRFDTYCLDGGAWDRPTGWGKFGTLEEALQCAKDGPAWRKGGGTPKAFLEGIRAAPEWPGVAAGKRLP
jgi:hypothetical protein